MNNFIPIDVRWPGAWEALERYIKSALEKGGASKNWDLKDIYKEALEKRVQVWGLVKDNKIYGSVVTKALFYPKRKIMEISFLGVDSGHAEDWRDLRFSFFEMLKNSGFAAVVAGGRPGWSKADLDLTTIHMYEKSLVD